MEKHIPIKLAYDVFESATGSEPKLSPLVLLHGLASDRKTWKDIAPILAENSKRRVYAYDARNFGESEYTEEFTFSLNVDDLFDFMDSVNVERAILFGHSMGAYTAVNAALRKPERVEMLINEDTYIRPATDQMIMICGDYLRELSHSFSKIPNSVDEKGAVKIIVDEMFDGLSEENKKWTPKDVLYKLYFPFKRDPDGGYSENYNEKALYEASQQPHTMQLEPVGSYGGPSVFFCGTKSIMNLESHKTHIKRHFPNAEFIEFEGGCHSLHAQFREEVVEKTIQFLNKHNIV